MDKRKEREADGGAKNAETPAPHLRFALVREEGLVASGDARALRVDEDLPRAQRYESPVDVHSVLVLLAGGVTKGEGRGGRCLLVDFLSNLATIRRSFCMAVLQVLSLIAYLSVLNGSGKKNNDCICLSRS